MRGPVYVRDARWAGPHAREPVQTATAPKISERNGKVTEPSQTGGFAGVAGPAMGPFIGS